MASTDVRPVTDAGTLSSTADLEPWTYFDRLQGEGGIVWDAALNAWMVSSYDLIKEIGRKDDVVWENFALPPTDQRPAPLGISADDWVWFQGFGSRRILTMVEGDGHDHQHRWWMRAFSPRVLQHWRETLIRPIASRQIDRFVDRGHAELGDEFAERVAPRVIAALMGLPHGDDDGWVEHVKSLIDTRLRLKQLWGSGKPVDEEMLEKAFDATRELFAVVKPYFEARRDGTGDDFISMIWRDADEMFNGDFDDTDVFAVAVAAWEGGAGSTPPSTANGLYMLLAVPGLQNELRNGGEKLMRNFVEESLRIYGPLGFRPRIAKHDVELGGVTVKKGEQIYALTLAGGHDAAHYSCPHEVDLARPAPRDHFSFLQGPRTCPGQGLARVELEELARVILERLPDLRLDPEADPPVYTGNLVRRWHPLNVLFTPGS